MVIPAVESRANVKVERLEAVEKGKWEGNDMTKIHDGFSQLADFGPLRANCGVQPGVAALGVVLKNNA